MKSFIQTLVIFIVGILFAFAALMSAAWLTWWAGNH